MPRRRRWWYAYEPAKFRADTRNLTRIQRYSYREIMDEIFESGQDHDPPSIADDDAYLAQIVGADSGAEWQETRRALFGGPKPFLTSENGRISQKRMTFEAQRARDVSEARKVAAEARWQKRPPDDSESTNSGRAIPTHAQAPKIAAAASPSAPGANGLTGIDLIWATIRTVAPQMMAPDDVEVSQWLRDINPDPWWIAAVICESQASLANGNRGARYLRSILKSKADEGVTFEDAAGYVTYFTSPERQQRVRA